MTAACRINAALFTLIGSVFDSHTHLSPPVTRHSLPSLGSLCQAPHTSLSASSRERLIHIHRLRPAPSLRRCPPFPGKRSPGGACRRPAVGTRHQSLTPRPGGEEEEGRNGRDEWQRGWPPQRERPPATVSWESKALQSKVNRATRHTRAHEEPQTRQVTESWSVALFSEAPVTDDNMPSILQ